MEKLHKYIKVWLDGGNIRNIKNVSLHDRYMIADIYNEIVKGNKPEFINGKCKEILDKCGIETIERGIGWKVL